MVQYSSKGGHAMSYNYCIDHRSGITYVYDVSSHVDDTGKRVSSRKLIGKLDENGNLVPTSGRRGRLPKSRKEPDPVGESCTNEQVELLKRQIAELRETIHSLQEEKRVLVEGLQKLLDKVH